jgi:PAS domain-containing protein
MVGIGLRKTLARGIATGIIIATAVPLQAQIKPDPQLATARSVWIEAEDELGDAPGVATCFAEEVHETLPLTVVHSRDLSQVILRFRPIDSRIELSVLLHDNQQLWSGTAAVPAGRTVTLPSRRCVAARELIEHLRAAMRCSRDGIWYQQPPDQPTEPLMSTSSAVADPQFDILSASYQIVEVNRSFWRFSWKMSVRTYGPDTLEVSPVLEFKNRGGFIVDVATSSMRTIPAQETLEITGTTLIDANVAATVTNAIGRATVRPLTSDTAYSAEVAIQR